MFCPPTLLVMKGGMVQRNNEKADPPVSKVKHFERERGRFLLTKRN